MSFVSPGRGETRAKTPLPASMFNSDDLPTFERPMKANSGNDSSGHDARSGALRSKMADEMFMINRPVLSHQIGTADITNFLECVDRAEAAATLSSGRGCYLMRTVFMRTKAVS